MYRLRFAPSPTGYLHLGNLRGVLFNYLFVKKHAGTFILRIDDTDIIRSDRKYEESFIEDLSHLDITFDEGPHLGGSYGPYRQSERLDIYKHYASILVQNGLAEEVESKDFNEDEKDQKKGLAVLLKVKENKEIFFTDLIFGSIKKELEDFIIIKSNGYPTYHFGTVVDDYLMKITHIIRGQDHLSNTAKHVLLYRYFNWPLPIYAHYSLTLNLSKRDGSQSLAMFRKDGYPKEAILNSAMLLGWAPKDQKEKFNVFDKVSEFELTDLKKVNVQFNLDKLNWLSSLYFKEKSMDHLYPNMREYLEFFFSKSSVNEYSEDKIKLMIQISLERIYSFKNFAEINRFFFEDVKENEMTSEIFLSDERFLNLEEVVLLLKVLKNEIQKLSDEFFNAVENAKNFIQKISQIAELKKGKKFFLTLRYILTQSLEGPELIYIVTILGKEKFLSKIEFFSNILNK